jgi:hypothetical protein
VFQLDISERKHPKEEKQTNVLGKNSKGVFPKCKTSERVAQGLFTNSNIARPNFRFMIIIKEKSDFRH